MPRPDLKRKARIEAGEGERLGVNKLRKELPITDLLKGDTQPWQTESVLGYT